MVQFEQSILLKRGQADQAKLEWFVEKLCDQFNIYNNYYGAILWSLSEVYAATCNILPHNVVKLVFKSSNRGFEFLFTSKVWNPEFIVALKEPIDIDEVVDFKEFERMAYALRGLTDSFVISDSDEVILRFDIASMHRELTLNRLELLNSYFKRIAQASKLQHL